MLLQKEKKSQDRVMPKQQTPVRIASASKSGSVLTIVFNQVVTLRGVPKYTTSVVGVTTVSATSPSPNTVAITFSAAITAATSVTIPFQDPAIRGVVGGFVADTTFPLS